MPFAEEVALLIKAKIAISQEANIRDFEFTGVANLSDATENDLIWIKSNLKNKQKLIEETLAKIIIVPKKDVLTVPVGKVLLKVDNPRLAFIKVIQRFFTEDTINGIHESSIIHPEAVIHPEAYIGPNCYVGKAIIGNGTVLFGNNFIYDKSVIGQNVRIHAGVVIGADGFGYEKDESGNVFKFPHLGGVIIEDNVEIGANTCIDRGSLSNTIIRKDCKIDNLVQVGHNVEVGERSFIIANTIIGGGTKIDNDVWISPSVSILNGLKIGQNSTVGIAANVGKNIPDGETWTGNPARPIKDYVSILLKLDRL
jgi:UDP-3-O-[3-hydroxymyristoyl] glucosamine N-acyltransferase